MSWQQLGTIETEAHRRLRLIEERTRPLTQADLDWHTADERAVIFSELKGYAAERAAAGKPYKAGWAAMKFKARFGIFPPRDIEAAPATECSEETRRWIKATMRDSWKRKA